MAASMKKLTVITFNAWSGLDYRGLLRMGHFEGDDARRARFRSLAAEIRRLKPDILGLSEANPLPFYARELASLSGMDEIQHMGVSGIRVGPFGIPSNLREGDMILARKGLCLRLAARAWLGGPGWVRTNWSFHTGDITQAVLGAITISRESFYAAQAHLRHAPPPNDATLAALDRLAREFGYTARDHRAALASLRTDAIRKEKEVLRLRDFLARAVPNGAPLLLMGDFNAEPSWPCMAPLLDAGYRAIAPGEGENTWDGEGNAIIRKYYRPMAGIRHGSLYRHLLSVFDTESRRIDFIMATPAITPERVIASGLCLTGAGGAALSDHYGVMATVEV
jgi:endonuclease/exonuclease/phosphatase family metal-dependent hydrolase